MCRVSHAQRSSRTLYDHRSTVLPDHLRRNRLKVRRQFVGLVQLFYKHSITLVYVTGMRNPMFVRILLLLLLARCVMF